MRGRWSVAALVAFVVLCAGLSQTGAGQSLLRDTGAVGPPPSYTQLVFTAPRSLPTQLKAAGRASADERRLAHRYSSPRRQGMHRPQGGTQTTTT